MQRTRTRRRLALLGILALALSVTAGFAVADTAAAKKKKKNKNPGGTVNITMPVNAQVPDATATTNGVLTSTINVASAKPFIGTVIRDVNVTLQTTGSTATPPGAASQLEARLTAPNGTTSWLLGNRAGPSVTGQSIGPLTLDDETPVQLVTGPPRDNTQLGPPYNGTAQPNPFTTAGPAMLWIMDGGPATGVWTLRVYDTVATGPVATSILNSWRLTMVAGKPFTVK